jgi:hypothetical protein
MTNEEAFENIRELGRVFVASMLLVTGKSVGDNSDLMNGIAGYQILKIKGEVEPLDKSFDIVMRIAYELLKDNLDAAIKKDGKHVH